MAHPGAPIPDDLPDAACKAVAGCNVASQAGDAAKDAATDAAGSAADSFMEKLIEGTINGLVEMIGTLSMAMFGVPGPNVGTVGGSGVQPSATLAHTFSGLSWLIVALTVVSLMVAIARMFWTLEAAEGKVIIRMMINLIASTTVILGMTVLMLEFADKASPWLMTRISGYNEDELNSGEKFAEALMGLDMSGTKGVTLFADLALIGLILLVITFFGVLAQIIFMIVRNPLIVAMCGFMPLFAASSGTRAGQERFNKALAFLVAFVLYKPVAAILLGIGLRMLKPLDAEENPLLTFVSGAVLIALTGFALPAMIKLFVPEAGVGSSNAFSGGAAIAAAGAAVMSTAMLAGAFATGGSSTAAAGAGGGGTGAGTPPPNPGGGGAGGAPPPPPPPPPSGSPQPLTAGESPAGLPAPTGEQPDASGEGPPAAAPAAGGTPSGDGEQPDTSGEGPPTAAPAAGGTPSGDVVSGSVVPGSASDSPSSGNDGADGLDGAEGTPGGPAQNGPPAGGGNDGGDAAPGGSGTPANGAPVTPEGAHVVGGRAMAKAAGGVGQRVVSGADTAVKDMSQGE